jgi:hypothetical protein
VNFKKTNVARILGLHSALLPCSHWRSDDQTAVPYVIHLPYFSDFSVANSCNAFLFLIIMAVPRLAVERKCSVFHFLVRIRVLSAVPDKGDPNQYGSTDLDPKHWRNENLSFLCRCIPELHSLYDKTDD